MSTPTATLDTSCVISLLRLPGDSTPTDELAALDELQRWQVKGRAALYISEKSRTEAQLNLDQASTVDPSNRHRSDKWLRTLGLLEHYTPTTGRWILGVSRLGIDTVLGSDAEADVYEGLAQLLFGSSPAQLRSGDLFDLAILFEHYIQQNELFVTRDKENRMLRKRAELQARWDICVCSPIEAVARLQPLIAT